MTRKVDLQWMPRPNGMVSIRAIRHAREENVFWGVQDSARRMLATSCNHILLFATRASSISVAAHSNNQ